VSTVIEKPPPSRTGIPVLGRPRAAASLAAADSVGTQSVSGRDGTSGPGAGGGLNRRSRSDAMAGGPAGIRRRTANTTAPSAGPSEGNGSSGAQSRSAKLLTRDSAAPTTAISTASLSSASLASQSASAKPDSRPAAVFEQPRRSRPIDTSPCAAAGNHAVAW
jgi:hypothetical protein